STKTSSSANASRRHSRRGRTSTSPSVATRPVCRVFTRRLRRGSPKPLDRSPPSRRKERLAVERDEEGLPNALGGALARAEGAHHVEAGLVARLERHPDRLVTLER